MQDMQELTLNGDTLAKQALISNNSAINGGKMRLTSAGGMKSGAGAGDMSGGKLAVTSGNGSTFCNGAAENRQLSPLTSEADFPMVGGLMPKPEDLHANDRKRSEKVVLLH